MNLPNGDANPLLENEEHKKEEFNFIENFFQKPSVFLIDSTKKIFNWKICTKIPLSCCFFLIASFFLFFLLGSFLITALILMERLYKEINVIYFTDFVIDPIINKKTNKTQALNIRNEILDKIYLESKLSNMQIAIEFINDINDINNINMEEHAEDFKAIKTSNNNKKLKDGELTEEEEETEKDYFLSELSSESNNEYSYKIFSSLTHYLKLFENNLDFDIFGKTYLSIKEIFIYLQNEDTQNTGKILTYCKNWDNENGLIESIFVNNNFQTIINEINKKRNSYIPDKYNDIIDYIEFLNEPNDFAEYITRNDFQERINQLNLLKFKSFNVTKGVKKYNFLIGLRLDPDSMISLFNKQNSNVTTILPVTNLTTETLNIRNNDLHLFYGNKYFLYFFDYGIKNTLYTSTLTINSQFSEEIDYHNTNLKIFFENLYFCNPNNEYLKEINNPMWKNEFIVISQLIKNINREIGDKYCSSLKCKNTTKDYNDIVCIINENLSQNNITFGDIPKKGEDDPHFKDLNKTVFYIHQRLNDTGRLTINYTLLENVFSDLEIKKSSIKIIYYNRTVNNLIYQNIEILNFTTYNSVKEEFIQDMDKVKFIVTIIRICFSLVFLFTSLYKIIKEVSHAIERINEIISLKDMLFNKTELKYGEDKDNDELNEKEKINSQRTYLSGKESVEEEKGHNSSSDPDNEEKRLLYDSEKDKAEKKKEKEGEKEREKWTKKHVYDSEFFKNGNKEIIRYTYNRLKSIFENMENYQSEKFTEKLVFLKRRYKLNEQNEDKEDCELSSDIYQAISKISIINMDDIFYNVYYNQSYALNQSFKMFRSILDRSINKQNLPQRNNKFINFGRILKIIYYFKKEKIQKIIEIIFDKDLKYKQQLVIRKENTQNTQYIIMKNRENLNAILNLTMPAKKKDGHRRSFIQMEQ